MKASLLSLAATLTTVTLFAQGTVFFNNRLPGTVVARIYFGSPFYSYQYGNGPADTPAGTTDWGGWNLCSGSDWSAQIWAAPGAGQPVSSLQAALPITTFRTGAAAGFVVPATVTLTGVAADAPVATLAVRVWNNQGGTITSWNQAMVAQPFTAFSSQLFDVLRIGGQANPAPSLDGLRSFGISIPEPTICALGTLGAVLLLFFRRNCRG